MGRAAPPTTARRWSERRRAEVECIGHNADRRARLHPARRRTLLVVRVHVDLEACTGHGRCYSLSPDVFDADDEGHCLLASEEVPPGLEEQARRGAANCPEQAITVEE